MALLTAELGLEASVARQCCPEQQQAVCQLASSLTHPSLPSKCILSELVKSAALKGALLKLLLLPFRLYSEVRLGESQLQHHFYPLLFLVV